VIHAAKWRRSSAMLIGENRHPTDGPPKLRSAPKAAMAKGGGLALALLFGVADFTDWEQVAKKPRRTKGMKSIASFSW